MFIRFSQPTFDDAPSAFDRANSLIDDLFLPPAQSYSFPAVDVAEQDHSFELIAELPGVKKDDIKISVENHTLNLSGERRHYGLPEGTIVIRHETRTEPFRRSFELPEDVDTARISAELANGILRVVLPKTEKAQAREIKIS